MVKLVLVAGFNPRVGKEGPQVLLGEGKWRIATENLKDTTFYLRSSLYEGTVEVEHGKVFKSESDNSFCIGITKPGTEEYITIFAEKVA